MKDEWVVCLGAGKSQLALIKNAKTLGYKVLVIDRKSNAPGMGLSDRSVIKSTHDTDAVMNVIKNIKVSGLLARTTGGALFTAAKIVEKYKIPGVNFDLARISTSKSELREFCLNHDIKVPHGKKILNFNEFNENDFSDEIIIKPDYTLQGKKSISRVLKSNKAKLNQAIKSASCSSGNKFVEVEDFIEGYDCSYLVWIEKGAFSTMLTWDELINFNQDGVLFQYGVSMPSISIVKSHYIKIKKVVDKFAKYFSETTTLLSFSFRVNKFGDPWLIEVHADMTGDLILDKLAPLSTECDILMIITKLFTINENKIRPNIRDGFVQKPSAILYDSFVNRENIKLLNSENIFLLHNEINKFTGTNVLDQKVILDDRSNI
jgi:hypothetical protein